MKHRRGFAALAAVLALSVSALVAPGVASAGTPSVRGFDGSTITVGSMGIASQFGKVPVGVEARIKQFNENNEIKGIQLKYTGLADDKQDQATALSEARRLVTQDQVFALVGDVSANNPKEYFAQQHVPYFGAGYDDSYCSHNASKSVWGFGTGGCAVPSDPAWVPDSGKSSYEYVSKKTGKKTPTIALLSNDTNSGKTAVKFRSLAFEGAGFKVVGTNNDMPASAVADYTPYAPAMLTADGANAPDAILCVLVVDCIGTYNLVKASGYTGTFIHYLYSDLVAKPLEGSLSPTGTVPYNQTTAGMTKLAAALNAYQPGAGDKIDGATITGYASTDMFIQALKTVAKKGKSAITPENVQKAAAVQTWQLPGVMGPTIYPQSTVGSYKACGALVQSDGTSFNQVIPFSCSTKRFVVK